MTLINVTTGANLQAAIDRALPGDQIVLQVGVMFPLNLELPNKSGDAYIEVTGSRQAEVPPGRITPALAHLLPKIVSPGANLPALLTKPAAHHYKFTGVEFSPASANVIVSDLIKLGDGGPSQNTLDSVPHHLLFDRCYAHGFPTMELKRAVAANAGYTEFLNCWIDEVHMADNGDTQAICGWNGPGPLKVHDCYLSSAGENTMFGGADTSIPGLIPSDIEFLRVEMRKPQSWNYWNQAEFKSSFGESVKWTTDPMPGPSEDPNDRYPPRWVGPTGNKAKHWSVKNLFETKNARRIKLAASILDGCWPDAQVGFAVLIKANNQDNTNPWAVTEDLEYVNNIVRNSTHGLNILGMEWEKLSGTCARLRFLNSLWLIEGIWFQGLRGAKDVALDHNTFIGRDGNVMNFADLPFSGFVATNNLGKRTGFGIKGDGTGEGIAALDKFAPGALFKGNILAGADPNLYPVDNFYPKTWEEIGLGPDFRLTTGSMFRGRGTDGKDPGCDMDAILAAQGGVTSQPQPVPVPIPNPQPLPMTPSPDGTKGTTITDLSGDVWTIGTQNQTLRNGIHTGGGLGTLYKWLSSVVYVWGLTEPNGTRNWWQWTGVKWTKVGDEPGVAQLPRRVVEIASADNIVLLARIAEMEALGYEWKAIGNRLVFTLR